MQMKQIENIPLSSLLKNNLYANGILVSDEVFEMLKSSQYTGYRTTTGIFIKLGGTLSKQEFEILKNHQNQDTLFSVLPQNLSFEDYLRVREYTTATLKKLSSIHTETWKNKTHLILNVDNDNCLSITGQYVIQNKKYPIKLSDCGIFKQDNYTDDEVVVLQAGGIRIRTSIGGNNCISGCKFCDFGTGPINYIDNTLTLERKKSITHLIRKLTLANKIQTLFITGGNPNLADMNSWTEFVQESIHTFKKVSPTGSIDLMLTPRGFNQYVYNDSNRYEEYLKYLQFLKSIGTTTISPNMELWEQKDLTKFCSVSPTKLNIGTTKSEIGHNGYMDFIKAGIEVFGKYNVRTSLIVGLNSNDNIKKAIQQLIPLGCHVVLSPFKPAHKSFYSFVPSDNDLIELSQYLQHEIDRTLSSLPINIAHLYKKKIHNSLNAHNSHNTANLCCGQELDTIEQQALFLEKDISIINKIQ